MPISSFLSKVRNRRLIRVRASDVGRRRRQVLRLLGGEQLEDRRLLTTFWLDTNTGAEAGARLGSSVATDNGLYVVGAPYFNDGAADSGTAYVHDATTGALVATLKNPTPEVGDHFGHSVAISGDRIVVGAPDDQNSGRAYVFDTDSGALIATLGNGIAGTNDDFGVSVAIAGNTVVVGAANDVNGGQAYVFSATLGTLVATLANPTPDVGDGFGIAVAAHGDAIVVGADGEDEEGFNRGQAYIFDATSHALVSRLLNFPPASVTAFGRSVAVENDTVIVGARGDAFIFDTSSGLLAAALQSPTFTSTFGVSVAVAGDKVAVGGGQVHVFDASDGEFLDTVRTSPPAVGSSFGMSVALLIDRVIVGEPRAGGADQGAVHGFSINTPPVPLSDQIVAEANVPTRFDVLGNDLDREGNETIDPARTVDTSSLTRGVLTNHQDGTFTFDPAGAFDSLAVGESSTVSFSYRAGDEGGESATSSVTIEVRGANDVPQAFEVTTRVSEDGAAATGPLLADDVDSDDDLGSLRYQISLDPTEGTATVADGSFTFDPGSDFQDLAQGLTREVRFFYRAIDRYGAASDPAAVNAIVTGVNDAPVAQSGTATVREGDILSRGQLFADDIDGDDHPGSLNYEVNEPGKGTLTWATDGSYTFDPGSDFDDLNKGETRNVLFTFRATDRHGLESNSATVILTVTGINDPPIAQNADAAVAEDGAAVSDQLVATDVANDPLVYQLTVAPDEGTATVDPDGSFTFDPGDDFQELAEGETRDVLFLYRAIRDDGVASNTGTVTVTVTGTNDAPVALSGAAAAIEGGGAVGGPLTANDGDSDDDAGSLVYQLVSEPGEGTATIEAEGSFTFDPGSQIQDLAEDETREFQFTYQATDSHGAVSNIATVVVTVTGANDAPTAEGGVAVADEDGQAVGGQLTASDPGNDPLVYELVSGPSEGAVTVAEDGSYTFDPGSDFQDLTERERRKVVFTFQATDSDNAVSNEATVTVTVTGRNDDPLAVDDTAITSEDAAVEIDALANDSDVDGGDEEVGFRLDSATVVSTAGLSRSPAAAGRVSIVGSQLVFDPGASFETLAAGETATATIRYSMSDGRGGSSTATAVVTVVGTNDSSAIVVFLAPGQEGRGITDRPVQFAGAFADLDASGGHEVTIDWNDGSESTVDLPDFGMLSLGQTFASTTDDGVLEIIGLSFDVVVFLIAHSFSAEGDYAVTWNVGDAPGIGDQRTTLFAVTEGGMQNPEDPLDVDGNAVVTPLDALVIINSLNRAGGEGLDETSPPEPSRSMYVDVNGDGSVGPLDALLVINHLNREGSNGDGDADSAVPAEYLTIDAEPAPPMWIVETVWRIVEGHRELPAVETETPDGAAYGIGLAEGEAESRFRGTSAARPGADHQAVDSVFGSFDAEENDLDGEILAEI